MVKEPTPYLTKTSYMAGIRCHKLLWLKWHQPLPYVDPPPGSPMAVGTYIGEIARGLFPGGTLIEEPPWEHAQALTRTRKLVEDKETTAIFEAAFEHDGVRTRVDILERDGNRWHIHEVKSSSSVKPEHVTDLTIQVHVLLGSGIDVASAGIMHVNKHYVRGEEGLNWQQYFARTDLSDELNETFVDVPDEISNHFDILNRDAAPDIEMTSSCKGCDYWGLCSADKPEHWVEALPNLSPRKWGELAALNIEDIRDIPDDFPLTKTQDRMRQVLINGETYVSSGLWKSLKGLGPPAAYLDFETMAPAIPLYIGTHPYQKIPFQWSLHQLDAFGNLFHNEFLAIGDDDPRRSFSEGLISVLEGSNEPILVYSSFERTTLNDMIKLFPDLKVGLLSIVDRLKDLLPIVRGHIYHKDFKGKFSIKNVAPALAPHVDYSELEGVADGLAASTAFERIAYGKLGKGESVPELRASLLKYCKLDTLAMVEVHRALMTSDWENDEFYHLTDYIDEKEKTKQTLKRGLLAFLNYVEKIEDEKLSKSE
jgi:CRISPR/Cas system-associated exonuclease Cas4 (RecB family)